MHVLGGNISRLVTQTIFLWIENHGAPSDDADAVEFFRSLLEAFAIAGPGRRNTKIPVHDWNSDEVFELWVADGLVIPGVPWKMGPTKEHLSMAPFLLVSAFLCVLCG